jgi:hypothetical protein
MSFDFTGGHAFHTHGGNIIGGGYAIKTNSSKASGKKKVSDNFENYVIPIGLSNNILEVDNPLQVEKYIESGPVPESLYDKLLNIVNIEHKEDEKEKEEQEEEKEENDKEEKYKDKEEEKPVKKLLNKTKPVKKSKQKKTKKRRS